MREHPYTLGDPHLGRRFNKGIPVDRRGLREGLIRADLNRHLAAAEGHAVHITMGDLFDKPQVAYEDLAFAAVAYTNAALEHPGTTFYILQGNHDDSRDLAEVTAWDIFCRLMSAIPNVTPVTSVLVGPDFILFPWDPLISAVEMVEKAAEFLALATDWKPTVAYGHWDTDPRSASHNLIPTKELAAIGITEAYTGHVHLPSTFKRDGVQVEVIGSMQPLAQGEDGGQGHIRYVTLTLDQLGEVDQDLTNACVRLQLHPGEQPPDTIPACMSWDVQRMRPVEEEAPADISMEGFDTTASIKAALDEHEIIPEVRDQVDARLAEVFGRAG